MIDFHNLWDWNDPPASGIRSSVAINDAFMAPEPPSQALQSLPLTWASWVSLARININFTYLVTNYQEAYRRNYRGGDEAPRLLGEGEVNA
jgi:hypothetical protein